jgi:hypothetical protein
LKDLHAAGALVDEARKKLNIAARRPRDPGFEAARRAYGEAQRQYQDVVEALHFQAGFERTQQHTKGTP